MTTSSQLEAIRAEAVRSRGFIRGAETQLTKVIDAVDAALAAPTPEPEPTPPPTPEPTGDALPAANWATVPNSRPDKIEVVAYHTSGIDRVEFGPWGTVMQPDPDTGLYTIPNNADIRSLGATVYPKQGKPRTLDILEVNPPEPAKIVEIGTDRTIVDALIEAGDGGKVILTGNGRYTFGPEAKNPLSNYKLPVTVESFMGATIEQGGGMIRPHCVIHWRGVEFDYSTISRYYYGEPWFNACGFHGQLEGETSPHLVTGKYYATKCMVEDRVYGFTYATLLRDSVIRNVWGDAFQGARTVIDLQVSDLDGTKTGHHSDMFQIVGPGNAEDPDPENYIIKGLAGRNLHHVAAFFFKPTRWTTNDPEAFTKTLRNSAFVDIDIQWRPSESSEVEAGANSQLQSRFDNILFKNVNMPQQPLLFRNDIPDDAIQSWHAKDVVLDSVNAHPDSTLDAEGVTYINNPE